MKDDSRREELLKALQVLSHPKAHGLTQENLDKALINFCADCPDPIQARWLVVECLEPMSDEELIDRILSAPSRPISDVPDTIIPSDHPARAANHDA